MAEDSIAFCCITQQLVNYYVNEKYTLRYTGGMVPDVNQVCPLLSYIPLPCLNVLSDSQFELPAVRHMINVFKHSKFLHYFSLCRLL